MSLESNLILSPLEAAHHLGITPELLFAYVRYAPKASGKDAGRRLPASTKDGATAFHLDDLLAFDDYLQEPWAELGDDRPDIPAYIGSHLKIESGGACARCGRGFNVQTAHIEDYAAGRSHYHHNLIRLCSLCHSEFDSKRILAAGEIATLKSALVKATRDRLALRINGPIIELQPPPLRTDYLFGRKECLDQLVSALVSSRLLCLHGTGGIGKTQLVLHALHQWNEKARILWLDTEPFSFTSDIKTALTSSMALAIGPAATVANCFSLIEEHADVVVFDGIEVLQAEDLVKFQAFMARLGKGTKTIRIVITSQIELLEVEGVRLVHVPPLASEASFDLVRTVAGEFASDQISALDTVIRFAEGHPLTLRVAAQLLRYFKSPSIVAERISRFGAATIALPGRQAQTKDTSLNACLSVAYRELSDDARRTLFALSYCPAGCFSNQFPWARLNINDSQLAVAELNHWGLVMLDDCWNPARLGVLSPIRSFCRIAFAQDDAVEANRLFGVLAEYVETLTAVLDSRYTKPGDAGSSTRRFEEEFPNLCYVFDEAVRLSSLDGLYDRLICSLSFSLQVFCFVSGRSHRGLRILDAGVHSASRLGLPGLASALLLQIANFSARVNDQASASAAYQRVVALSAGEDDPELSGNVSYASAMLALADGRRSIAEAHLLEAADFYSRSPAPLKQSTSSCMPVNQRMQALALMQLAMRHEHSGREIEALKGYEQASDLMRSINDRVNEGTVLHQMGNCHAQLQAFPKAYRCYVQAARHFFELGSAIHISNSLGELGFVLLDYPPDSKTSEDLSADIIRAGFDDLFRELLARFNPSNSHIELDGCEALIRKLMGALCLGSLSRHEALLIEFSRKLEASLTRPLIERFRGDRARGDRISWVISHLHIIMLLAGGVQGESRASIEEIAHHADLCYILGEFSWISFRLFDWLAIYLQRRRGWPDISATKLHNAIDDITWGGDSFSITD